MPLPAEMTPAVSRRCLTAAPVPLPGALFVFGGGSQPDGALPLFTLGGGIEKGAAQGGAQRQVVAAHAEEETSSAYRIQVRLRAAVCSRKQC
jgi:hypothetical protein